MENARKFNIIIIILIAVVGLLIYQNIKFQKEMGYMESRISNMESNINQGINNLNYSISNNIENLLSEQQSMVSDYNSAYSGVDPQTETVKTVVEFTLKQSDPDSRVYLHVSTEDQDKGRDYECASTNGLNYACEVELPYKNNYIFDMYEKSADGSSKKLNSNPYYNNIKRDFANRVRLSETGTSINKDGTDYSFSLQNKTFGEQSFKVKSVVVKAFLGDKEVFAKDVTQYNIMNSEAREKMNLMMAAGEMSTAEIPKLEYGKISTDGQGNEYGSYIVTVLHSETGAVVERNNYPKYTFKVIVTLNNGEVYTL